MSGRSSIVVLLKELTKKDALVSEGDKEEFVVLTKRLMDIMVDFSILTLKTFGRKKSTELTHGQIEDIINFDLQFRIQQIQDPEFMDIVRERVLEHFSDT